MTLFLDDAAGLLRAARLLMRFTMFRRSIRSGASRRSRA